LSAVHETVINYFRAGASPIRTDKNTVFVMGLYVRGGANPITLVAKMKIEQDLDQ
jgi:hypothetical protein